MGMTRADEIRYKWYLAALVDGEGSVDSKRRRISISNTDQGILDFCCMILDQLGYTYSYEKVKKQKDYYTQAYTIRLYKRIDVDRFYLSIPVQSLSKKASLKKIFNSPRNIPKDKWPIEKIRKLYNEGYGTSTINKKLNIKNSRYYIDNSDIVKRPPFHERNECKRGHKFDKDNTYLYKGMRHCKACKTLRKKAASGAH